MTLLEKAISIALEAHCGQKDGDGSPYILHPLRMMARVETGTQKIVAILHDVVENTDWTFKDLEQKGFSKKVLKSLDCLTRRRGESYKKFVKRAASDPVAKRVKLADLLDNMDVRRLEKVTPKNARRLSKYNQAWRFLIGD